jgi:predicted nicotinamide N-methyase
MVARQTEGLPLLEELIPVASFRKLNIIELGSGCGIVGISLAQLIPDCSVLLTDLPEAREIAERNIAGMKPATDSRARYQELDWEQPLPKAIQAKTFDLIIVADCTYNPDSGPALVQTLEALVEKSPKSGVLLSMKVRHDSELVFFDLMKKANFVQKTQIQVTLPELGSDPEDVLVYIFHHKERQVYAENKTQLQNKSAVPFSPE